MRHPTEGVLRRLLDEPAGVADSDRRHVAGCPHCLDRLATVREDAALVDAALTTGDSAGVDVDAAWDRFLTAGTPRPQPAPSRARRPRDLARRPIVAALAAAFVLAGAGAAGANNWFRIFRTEQVAPVSISSADLISLPDLDAYGDFAVTSEPNLHEVPDAATAATETGLDVPVVGALPRGVTGQPSYQAGRKLVATFTFSVEKAAKAAKAAGETLPPPPPGIDGSQVRLAAGPGVAEVWRSGQGTPALVVGRAVAPSAFSSGVPFETVRDYLLSLPGLPDDVAAQLRGFTADGTTLPLPVPADEVRTSSAAVHGQSATVLVTRDRTMAAVVWVNDDVMTVVVGSLDADEVLSVARALG